MARNGKQEAVAKAASKLLADSYTLYLKTHNFHWNVTGPMFAQLHTLFETQYTELAAAVDEIAERIRALGEKAPGSYEEFGKLAKVKDAGAKSPKAMEMIRTLADDNATVAESARALVSAAEDAGDDASADLGVRRIEVADKNSWMLRSHLE